MPDQIQGSARGIDLSPRMVATTTVVGSPALAAETIVAQVAIPGNLAVATGVFLNGWVAYTVGTSGTSAQLRLRQTNVAGTVVANSGVLSNHAAGVLAADDIQGIDTAPVGAQVYVLTLQIAAGAAASAVSAVFLSAFVV